MQILTKLLKFIANPMKSFEILTHPHTFLQDLDKSMQILSLAHSLRISVSLQIMVNPYKSMQSYQILASLCKSLQIHADPCKSLEILTIPDKS